MGERINYEYQVEIERAHSEVGYKETDEVFFRSSEIATKSVEGISEKSRKHSLRT